MQVKGLTKEYWTNRKRSDIKNTVSNVSFEIIQNQILGILGPSGAGKSTIFKILAMMIKRTSGYVKLLDIDFDQDKACE